jgi:hypothetical protein
LLFWCRSGAVEDTDGANGGSSSGSSGAGVVAAAVPNTLDTLIGCLDGLLGLAAHARAAGRGGEAACLEDALREVSAAAAAATASLQQLHPLSQLLRRSLSRTVCLLVGATDVSSPNVAAAPACAHANFLRRVVEILSPASSSPPLLAAVCAAVTVEARLTLPPSPNVLAALAARGRQAAAGGGAALAVAAQRRFAEALAAVAGAATVVYDDEAHAALGRAGAVPRAAGCVHVVV